MLKFASLECNGILLFFFYSGARNKPEVIVYENQTWFFVLRKLNPLEKLRLKVSESVEMSFAFLERNDSYFSIRYFSWVFTLPRFLCFNLVFGSREMMVLVTQPNAVWKCWLCWGKRNFVAFQRRKLQHHEYYLRREKSHFLNSSQISILQYANIPTFFFFVFYEILCLFFRSNLLGLFFFLFIQFRASAFILFDLWRSGVCPAGFAVFFSFFFYNFASVACAAHDATFAQSHWEEIMPVLVRPQQTITNRCAVRYFLRPWLSRSLSLCPRYCSFVS